ncbi:MFS transporter [Metasolibacillus meyeri]|uniref:MFS transporter n=1 Tax=Metasolibacillus meyeri TaxID=1071052 RepID=UPI000D2F73CC|nr:MFS transporter [Metasolibacillus meyeri]
MILQDIQTFSRAINIRIALRFLTILSNAMVMPYMAVFFVKKIGAEITTLFVIFIGATSILGYLFEGRLADIYGRKKLILIGESFVAIGFFIVAFCHMSIDYQVYGSLVGFLLVYFFSSVANPAYSAFIIDESTPENRKSIYTILLWTAYLGLTLGSFAGGFLFAKYTTHLFFVVGLSAFVSFLCILFFIKDTYRVREIEVENTTNHQKGSWLFVYREILRSPAFLMLVATSFIFSLMDEQLSYYLGIHYVRLFAEDGYQLIGFLRGENTIIAVFATLFLVRLLRGKSEMSNLLLGTILFFLGYISLSYFEQFTYLYIAMAVASIGEIIWLPAQQTLVANSIPDQYRSTYSSVLGISSTIGGVAGAIFILLSAYLNSLQITFLYALLGVITITVVIIFKNKLG